MEPIYTQNFTIEDVHVDRFGKLKPSMILYIAQEMSGRHSELMNVGFDTLYSRNLFWAVNRHRVQITRLPEKGETIRVETWPLPATHAAFPRSVIAYDSQGSELFRCMSLWVLMDVNTRRMIFPDRATKAALSQRHPDPEDKVLALATRDELVSLVYPVTGANALRKACALGLIVHILGGIVGLLIMFALAFQGSVEILTPEKVLLYQLIWMVPGLLVTEWARTV